MDVHPEDVYREGITKLTARDFDYARELGYAIKLLAIGAQVRRRACEVRVHPALVPTDELLANVDGVLNAVEIEGDLMNRVLFQGPGAGSLPTTSAVVADALDAAVSISNNVYWPHSFRREAGLRVLPMSDVRIALLSAHRASPISRACWRASRARWAMREISIASVIQKEVDGEGTAEIVIMTHDAREDDVQRRAGGDRGLEGVDGVEQVLRVKP